MLVQRGGVLRDLQGLRVVDWGLGECGVKGAPSNKLTMSGSNAVVCFVAFAETVAVCGRNS